MPDVIWKRDPEDHDYSMAAAYPGLRYEPDQGDALVVLPRAAATRHWKAKDIRRASQLPPLPIDNPHGVDRQKIAGRTALSPVLPVRGEPVRGDLTSGRALPVADGYHRACASYHNGENTGIPSRLAAHSADATCPAIMAVEPE